MPTTLSGNRLVMYYSVALAGIVLLLKWLEVRYLILGHAFEVYIGVIALIFTCLGIWLAHKLSKPKTVILEKEVFVNRSAEGFIPDEARLLKMGISKREWEVLDLMAKGLSNQEIAGTLFLSLNTIKTHSSRLFEKLDVKRRTQAIGKAKNRGILP